VNPLSCISGVELGMALVNAGQPRDAIGPLWEAHARELASDWFTRTARSEAKKRQKTQKQQPQTQPQQQQGEEAEEIEEGGEDEDPRMPHWGRMANLMRTR
jgi:hypothetical protein